MDKADEFFDRLENGPAAGAPKAEAAGDEFDQFFANLEDPNRVQRRLDELRREVPSETTTERVLTRAVPFVSAGVAVADESTYRNARAKLEAGTALDGDLRVIAEHERRQFDESQKGFGAKAVDVLLGVPAIMGEMAAAGPLGGAIRGTGLAARGARLAATTAAAPSFYLPAAAQRATEQGGDTLSPQNLGPAFGMGLMQNAILGSFSNIAKGVENPVGRFLASVGIGMGEAQAGKIVASALDEFLPVAYQTRTRYGIVGDLVRGEGGKALEDAALEALTFAAFTAAHGNPKRAKEVVEAVKTAADSAETPEAAAAAVRESVKTAESETPREAAQEAPGPRQPVPEVQKPPEAAPEAPEKPQEAGGAVESPAELVPVPKDFERVVGRALNQLPREVKKAVAAGLMSREKLARRIFEKSKRQLGGMTFEQFMEEGGFAPKSAAPQQASETAKPAEVSPQPSGATLGIADLRKELKRRTGYKTQKWSEERVIAKAQELGILPGGEPKAAAEVAPAEPAGPKRPKEGEFRSQVPAGEKFPTGTEKPLTALQEHYETEAAKRWLNPGEVESRAQANYAGMVKEYQTKRAAYDVAMQALKEFGVTPATIRKVERKGLDAAAIKGIDEVADTLARRFPELFDESAHASDTVFQLIQEAPRAPTQKEAYEKALGDAERAKGFAEPAKKPAEPMSPDEFARVVKTASLDVADALMGRASGKVPEWDAHKPLIADVYDAAKDQLGGMSLAEFKTRLLDANRKGTIRLSRLDMPETMFKRGKDREAAYDRGGIDYLNARFDTLAIPEKDLREARKAREARSEFDDAGASVGESEEVAPGVMFAGFPIQFTFLERLLTRGFNIKAAVRKWLSSAGDLPKQTFELMLERDQSLRAEAQKVADAVRDLQKATGPWRDLKPGQIKVMNDALAGDLQSLASLPVEVGQAVNAMRQHIDVLSDKLMQAGAIQGELALQVDANKGSYITRRYKVFEDPNWFAKVDPQVKNFFKSWLEGERLNAGITSTPEELEGITMKLLREGKASENPLAFLQGKKLGAKDLSILKERGDIPAPLRALWGEIEDPIANYANTVLKQASLLMNHEFQKATVADGMGNYLFDEPTPTHHIRIAKERPVLTRDDQGNVVSKDMMQAMGPLAGKYTTPEIAKAFEEVYSPKNVGAVMAAYNGVLALTKHSKTVASPTTHARNFLGNGMFVVANGHVNVPKAWEALKAVVDDTPAGRDRWRRYIELGVIENGVAEGELRSIAKDALRAGDDNSLRVMHMVTDRDIVRAGGKLYDMAAKAYKLEDAIPKIYAFENELARYRERMPNVPVDQVEKIAARIVQDTYPTWDRLPRAVKALRRDPILSSFPSFASEVFRTTYKTAVQAAKEIADPVTRPIGIQRAVGLSLAASMTYGMAAASRGLVGLIPDVANAMRSFMPSWSRDDQLVHLDKPEDGKAKVVALGPLMPHSQITDLVGNLLSGNTGEGLKNALRPFLSPEIMTGKIGEAIFNEKLGSAGRVYNPQDTAAGFALDVGAHLGEAFMPAGSLPNLYRAATGRPNPKTGKVPDLGQELLANLGGVRVQEIDVNRSLPIQAREFMDGLKDAEKLQASVQNSRGLVSDKDLLAAKQKADDARRRLFDDMRKKILDAQRLDVTPEKIGKLLEQGGVPQRDRAALLQGYYAEKPPKPMRVREGEGEVPYEEVIRRRGVVAPK